MPIRALGPKYVNSKYRPMIAIMGAPEKARIHVRSISAKSMEIILKNYPFDTSCMRVRVVDWSLANNYCESVYLILWDNW